MHISNMIQLKLLCVVSNMLMAEVKGKVCLFSMTHVEGQTEIHYSRRWSAAL